MKRVLAFLLALLLLLPASIAGAVNTIPKVAPKPPAVARVERVGRGVLIHLEQEIDEDVAKAFRGALDEAEKSGAGAILLIINSRGGAVQDGFKMIHAIEESRVPIVCVVDGEADSMAFALLQSCPARVMTRRSSLMLHEVSQSGGFNAGHEADWRSIADELRVATGALAEQYGWRMKLSIEEVQARIAGGRQWWMGWKEALEVGAVDKVIETPREIYGR